MTHNFISVLHQRILNHGLYYIYDYKYFRVEIRANQYRHLKYFRKYNILLSYYSIMLKKHINIACIFLNKQLFIIDTYERKRIQHRRM